MLAGSIYVIATKPTKKGLDLSGGTQLIYQGEPSADNPTIDGDDIDRAIEIIRDRVDALGVSEPEIAPLGTDQIQISLPNVQDTQRAIQQVGDTAKLYFYDLEPNIVPLDPKTSEVTPANLQQQSTTSLYDAVEVASKQNTKCGNSCTTTAPQLYLFEKKSRQFVAGPETTKRDLFSTDEAKAVPKDDQKIFTVPQGTIVVQDQENTDNPDAPASYFVLRDKPALSGDDIKNPEQNFDQNQQPNVTFDFTDEGRQAFQTITRQIAQRGSASQGAPYAFAIVLDGKIVSRPIIDYNENPDGIDGRTGAQISGSFTTQEAQDLATFLKIGALPINLKLDQPEHGHGDARPAGPRRRPQGRPDRPAARLDLLPPLLPPARRDRDRRPRRLRRLLPGDHEADPDHADPAGHRGTDPDHRRGRRLERRHIRANKGGVPEGALDDLVDHDGIQARHQHDRRRERDHAADRVHPLRAGDRRRQGLRLHARRRHDRLAAHRCRLHPRRARAARPQPDPALAGVPRRPHRPGRPLALRLRRGEPLVLLDLRA